MSMTCNLFYDIYHERKAWLNNIKDNNKLYINETNKAMYSVNRLFVHPVFIIGQ